MKIKGFFELGASTYTYELNVGLINRQVNLNGGKISFLKLMQDNRLIAYFQRGWYKICKTVSNYKILSDLIEEYN